MLIIVSVVAVLALLLAYYCQIKMAGIADDAKEKAWRLRELPAKRPETKP